MWPQQAPAISGHFKIFQPRRWEIAGQIFAEKKRKGTRRNENRGSEIKMKKKRRL